MATEIERKYLVRNDDWRARAHRDVRYLQGYLATTPHCSVRVRVGGDAAFLNVKGATVGASRLEFEYPVPVADAEVDEAETVALPDWAGEEVTGDVRYYNSHLAVTPFKEW
jgi:adenylate cyclase